VPTSKHNSNESLNGTEIVCATERDRKKSGAKRSNIPFAHETLQKNIWRRTQLYSFYQQNATEKISGAERSYIRFTSRMLQKKYLAQNAVVFLSPSECCVIEVWCIMELKSVAC